MYMYNFILENELHTIGTNKIITPALPYYHDQKNFAIFCVMEFCSNYDSLSNNNQKFPSIPATSLKIYKEQE